MSNGSNAHALSFSGAGSSFQERVLLPYSQEIDREGQEEAHRYSLLDNAKIAWSLGATEFHRLRTDGRYTESFKAELLKNELECLQHLCFVPLYEAIIYELLHGTIAPDYEAVCRQTTQENLKALAEIILERRYEQRPRRETEYLSGFGVELSFNWLLVRNGKWSTPATLRQDHHSDPEKRADLILHYGKSLKAKTLIQSKSSHNPDKPDSDSKRVILYADELLKMSRYGSTLETLYALIEEADGKTSISNVLDKVTQDILTKIDAWQDNHPAINQK